MLVSALNDSIVWREKKSITQYQRHILNATLLSPCYSEIHQDYHAPK